MARIRNIKPAFFKDEDLADLSFAHRLLFAGLWTLADKHGTLEDRPRFIRAELFPYDQVDCAALLDDLVATGFLLRYTVAGKGYLHVPTFTKHQRISGDEQNAQTALPLPEQADLSGPDADEAGKKQVRSREEAGPTQVRSTPVPGVLSTEYGVLTTEDGARSTDTRARATGTAAVIHPDWGAHPARKRKGHCAWESAIGVDVPAVLHDEFLAKLASGGDADADATLHGWYRDTERAYAGQTIGDDSFTFWRARFKEWRGTTVKVASATDQARIFENAMAALGVRA